MSVAARTLLAHCLCHPPRVRWSMPEGMRAGMVVSDGKALQEPEAGRLLHERA